MADIILKLEGAGATKQITIAPEASKNTITNAYLVTHPIPQIQDPAWVDPMDGTPPDMIDAYGPAIHFLNNLSEGLAADVFQGLMREAKVGANETYKAMKAAGAFEVLTSE